MAVWAWCMFKKKLAMCMRKTGQVVREQQEYAEAVLLPGQHHAGDVHQGHGPALLQVGVALHTLTVLFTSQASALV